MNDVQYISVRKSIRNFEVISEQIASQILHKLCVLLKYEANILEIKAPVIICGDIHGQLPDLLSLFSKSGGVDENGEINKKIKYLFMGDYVDRGYYSLNTFLYLATLKLDFPDYIFLLRGNHESRIASSQYGFSSEVLQNYGHLGLWNKANECFSCLPIAAITYTLRYKIFSVHGGISPNFPFLEQLNRSTRYKDAEPDDFVGDLFWSDPDPTAKSFQHNSRGAGYIFGKKQLVEFCNRNKIDLVTRSHQLAMKGYDFSFGKGTPLLTIWSAPNYMYRSGNDASFLSVTEDMHMRNIEEHIIKFDKGDQRMPEYYPILAPYFC